MVDVLIVIAIVATTAAYGGLTAAIPVLAVGDPLGPRAFPSVITAGMAISAVLLALEIWRARRAAAPAQAEPSGQPPLGRRGVVSLGTVVLCFVLYVLLVEPLGFVLASGLFLMASCTTLNRRIWRTNLTVAIGVPLALYLLLAKLLMVPLPAGLLPF